MLSLCLFDCLQCFIIALHSSLLIDNQQYFSTLERLRLAHNSTVLPASDGLVAPQRSKRSVADRRGMKAPTVNSASHTRTSGSHRLRKLSRPSNSSSANEASWFLVAPDSAQDEASREERITSSVRVHDSIILDAADEAWAKASRRRSRNLAPIHRRPDSSSSHRKSMESTLSNKRSSISRAMYESFRWMDEEDDLDLRLVLDDYHANIDGVVLPSPTSTNRPSYRRHMSISKVPFGRASVSSMNQSAPNSKTSHTRQKSKAMSILPPKHDAKESVSSIDPHATHYQDPEARLKLRVYLASPQKFDEAIEFGFPSTDGVLDVANKENRPMRKGSRDGRSTTSPFLDFTHSFLRDEAVSLFEDDMSIVEPESPLTPADGAFTKNHVPDLSYSAKQSQSPDELSHLDIVTTCKKPSFHKPKGSYTQSAAGSREMTLRMTLTRPDLRADESALYGWQDQSNTSSGTPRTKSPLQEDPLALDALPMEKIGPLGGADGWGLPDKEESVVKRLWNRVKNTQRKSS